MKSDQLMPRINTNDNEVEIVKWLVEDMTYIEKGSDLVEVSTSKAVVVLESEHSGFIKKNFAARDIVKVGAVIASIHKDLKSAQSASAGSAKAADVKLGPPQKSITKNIFGHSRFSKGALEYASSRGVDTKQINGAGLISARRLREQLEPPQVKQNEVPAPLNSGPAAVDDFVPDPDLYFEKITRNKKLEIKALTAGQQGNINSSLTVQFNSEKIRTTLKSLQVFNGQLLPIFLFELSRLLEKNRLFTSFYHDENIYFYHQVNIGVAIDMEKGLKVVVIKKANQLMPIDIYKQLIDFSIRYTRDKLTVHDVSEGTVTVTDLSGYDILHFQPLVNQAQTAIFGFGGDSRASGHPMSITCVFDHRVLSGREVAIFLNELKSRILSFEAQNFSVLK